MTYRSKIMDYLVNGGDEADLAKAEAEYTAGALGLEIEENEKLRAEIERLRAALTPSTETKAAYIGEFRFDLPRLDEFGDEYHLSVTVPWDTIKEIMKAIRARADEQLPVSLATVRQPEERAKNERMRAAMDAVGQLPKQED